jgi:sec-independent protein translocase protein TatC
MSLADRDSYSEDMFADTRMTFGEHLEDLRKHLWRAIYGFLIALVISFVPGWYVLEFISAPVEQELNRFYARRAASVAEDLKAGRNEEVQEANKLKESPLYMTAQEFTRIWKIEPPEDLVKDGMVRLDLLVPPVEMALTTVKAQQLVSRRFGLSTLAPQEAIMAYIKVCLVCGLVLGSPWIFIQIWAFVAAGLYPNEKRLVNVYLPFSVVLFVAGALVCQFWVIPKALQALLWFNQWLKLEPDIRFNEWLGFAILLPVLFGLSFQLPLIMLFLERVGIFSVETYVQKWRIACFLIFVFSSFVTPVDAISMLSLALAMCALYGLGILLCKLNPNKPDLDVDVPDSEDLVEV